MTRWRLLLVSTSLLAIPLRARGSDLPAAQEVVERMLTNLGGAGAPYAARSIAFTFSVEKDGKVETARRHTWHPGTGDHQVLFANREGNNLEVRWNIHARQGVATRDGQPLAGEDLAAALDQAWKLWVNDTWWLLMPYKLRDPGVRLSWDGEAAAEGRLYDLVKVTFDEVGLTPGDTYWAWIARDTGLMERWSFVLEGREPPPVVWRWLGYRPFGPLVLSTRKELLDGSRAIVTADIVVE